MIWKCLIVDDEPPAIKVLEKYVGLAEGLQLAGTCANAFTAMTFLKAAPVDLIFLDIQMPKLSGIGFLKTLQHPPKVIFTTAYKEFAIDAFDLDAVDYLLKPVSLERFLKAVNKLTSPGASPVEKAVSSDQSGFLYFRSQRKMVKVFLDDILYIESVKDYIKIFRKEDKPLLVKGSITTLEAMLPVSFFVRIHRSFIVAVKHITAFTAQDVEIGDVEIPVGRLYGGALKKLGKEG
ncbi:MAG TPA: LytTR family DNA-binding domain-containing protein [Flavisolibacter sp.]|nr:LytTR family DNA-binding domain-containing protein [Flavisolibacter sp.]